MATLLVAACGGSSDGNQSPRVQYSSLVSFGDFSGWVTGGATQTLHSFLTSVQSLPWTAISVCTLSQWRLAKQHVHANS